MAEARARREEERAGLRLAVPENVMLRDRVRWGSVWAGVVVALGILLVLSAIGVAIGFAVTGIATPEAIRAISLALAIWTAFSAIIALFVGGYIAGRLMPLDTRGIGAVHGIVVWGLTLVIGAVLELIVVGLLLTFLGDTIVAVGPEAISGIRIGPAELRAIANTIASTAGWFVLWSLLALGSAVLGGYLGMANSQKSRAEIP